MKTSEQLNEIGPALVKAQQAFKGVAKSGENKFDRYSYANLEDYVRAVRPVLNECGLSALASVEEVVALPDRTTQKGGTEHAVRVKLCLRVLHAGGQWVEVDAWGEGQDRADKAIYKAITGARKYAMAALGLATTDDPEADETTGQAGRPQQRQQPRQQQQTRTPTTQADSDTDYARARAAEQQADPLDDDETFVNAVGDLFLARGFDADEEKLATAAVLKGYGVDRLEALDLARRNQLVAVLKTDRLDKYKGKAGGGKPAAAAPAKA